MTFAPIPREAAVSDRMRPRVPGGLRRRVLRWIAGGAEVDDAAEARADRGGTTDFVVQRRPRRFTDDSCARRAIPVLAI